MVHQHTSIYNVARSRTGKYIHPLSPSKSCCSLGIPTSSVPHLSHHFLCHQLQRSLHVWPPLDARGAAMASPPIPSSWSRTEARAWGEGVTLSEVDRERVQDTALPRRELRRARAGSGGRTSDQQNESMCFVKQGQTSWSEVEDVQYCVIIASLPWLVLTHCEKLACMSEELLARSLF